MAKQAVTLLGSLAEAMSEKAQQEINKLTEKEKYEFGDLTKWAFDRGISKLTDKEEADLSDLTAWVDGRIKELGSEKWLDRRIEELKSSEEVKAIVNNLEQLGNTEDVISQLEAVVGKETTDKLKGMVEGNEIQLGEIGTTIGNEILELLKNKEYNISDYILLFKILSAVGLSLNPGVLAVFPLNLLLQLYNASLVGEISSHITGALALEIDKRAKQAFAEELEKQTKKALTGDPEASVGDVFKKAILDHIGKGSYDFGDVTRKLQTALQEDAPAEELTIGESSEDAEALAPELAADAEVLQEALAAVAEAEEVLATVDAEEA